MTLPASGYAEIASDFHGHQGDFEAFLARTRVEQRLLAGEDVYLVITGDVPDLERHRALDTDVDVRGDVRILDRLIALEARLGERGRRVIYLEGNHDFHIVRIAREIALFEARQKHRVPPPVGVWEPLDPISVASYFEHYKDSFGLDVFLNNIQPYDMIHRVEPRHLAFLSRQPILAVLEGARTLVTHAGPPKMSGVRGRALRKEIEAASRDVLSSSEPHAYYSSPYHQLLNNRFRARDYSLDDVEGFLGAFSAGLLVTGHTPHPYLVDFALKGPLAGCDFRDGLGFVGKRQVVLCTSFGAFDASRKRYLELDLARPYAGVDDLRSGREIQALYPDALRPRADESETAQIVRAMAERHGDPESPTSSFDPNAVTQGD